MKYLIIARAKANPPPLCSEHLVFLLNAAKQWVQQERQCGTLDAAYSFISGGGVAILNGDSHEQVVAKLLSYSLYSAFDWDIFPLVDIDVSYKLAIDSLERMLSPV
jgi:hypothetical protein